MSNSNRLAVALVAAVCVLIGITGEAVSTAAEPLEIGLEKQVFIDGRFIADSQGVHLTVNKPKVRNEQLVVQEHPWEDLLIGGYQTVIQEGNLVHLWYETADMRGGWGVAYARSDDYGATWTKPNLGVVQYQGSTSNNLVMKGIHGHTVFWNRPNAPPEERYVMFVGKPNKAFVSPDGYHWTQSGSVPFLNMGSYVGLDSQNIMFWDMRLEKYVAYPRVMDPGWGGTRTVGRSVSDTLGGFPVPTIVFAPDENDPADMDFYTSALVEYPYAANAYFMFPAAYYHEPGPNVGPLNIQFAASRDGIHWERYDRDNHIVRGFDKEGNPTDNWQEQQLYAGYGLTRQGNELSLYYKSNPVKHGEKQEDGSIGGVITRAIYRLDGFTSVDAGPEGGQFTTPALLFEGGRLLLNAAVAAGGLLKLEILDEQGNPVTGFGRDDADTLAGDSVAMTPTWNGSGNLSSLRGKTIKLHFIMDDAKIYAFQAVVPDPTAAVETLGAAGFAHTWFAPAGTSRRRLGIATAVSLR